MNNTTDKTRFGEFGGQYVDESLLKEIKKIEEAYEHYKNEITLPLHTCLSDEQVEYVIENFFPLQILNYENKVLRNYFTRSEICYN